MVHWRWSGYLLVLTIRDHPLKIPGLMEHLVAGVFDIPYASFEHGVVLCYGEL